MNYEKSKFDSVILAGGFGTRLSPLTDSMPKPMLPIACTSAYERSIALLRKHGFKSTAVTTMYLPEKIERIKGEGIEYLREELPLGSAGALAKIKQRAEDCVIVLSGDAFCDFDLAKARLEFLQSGCDAAILLCRRSDAGEYGSVCLQNGRVVALCEKPSLRDTLSDLINTGIYFIGKSALELIPENKKYDFARDLFPQMLRSGMCIAGIEPQGHWFDIGTLGEYHRCNMWVSNGESCIGKGVSLHPEARVEHSVIFENCTIGNSVLRGCIVGEGATIGNDCIIPPGCVIGAGAEIRDNSALAPGRIVYTGETVVGESYIESFKPPKNEFELGDDSVIAGKDEGFFVRLGRLLGGSGSIIAFAEGGGATLPQACELACGASEAGSGCTVISGGNAAAASFCAGEYRSKTAFISQNGERTEIFLFSSGGMPFAREALRSLASASPQTVSTAGSVYLLPHGALVKRYLQYLRDNCEIPKRINIKNGSESAFLREIADELSIKRDTALGEFYLSDDGTRAGYISPSGQRISYWQLLAVCCIEGDRSGIILPNDTPATLEQILRRHSVDVAFYGDSDSDVRRLAEGDRLHRDGCLLALTACALAERKGTTVEALVARIPPFSVITRHISADRERMCAIISKLRERCGSVRCAGFDFGDGRVNVYASASGRFRLIAEAIDSETAEEITLRAIDRLREE